MLADYPDFAGDPIAEEEFAQLAQALLEIEKTQEREKWQNLFPDEGPLRRELYPRHMEFFAAGATYRERLFMAANRVGKAQPNDEPVLTPSGWKNMGDIRPGDFVIGSDGSPTKVVRVHPQGVRKVVSIAFSDGSETRCDLDHLWTVRPTAGGRSTDFETMTTSELRERVMLGERWMLPQRPEVQFEPGDELPINPYLVGLLLGDGGLSTGVVLLSSDDEEIVEFAKAEAQNWACNLRFAGGCTWHFATHAHRRGGHHNFLKQALIGLGMIGKTSHNKRIPERYLFASSDDRMALLQGLMDSDGSCGPSNGARSFYSVNRDLCEDVAHLARSLGMNASVRQKSGLYRGEAHTSWKTHINNSPHSIFRLERKGKNQRFSNHMMRGIMVESITSADDAECMCIEVEAQDSLYLTKDFIVTHNTVGAAFEVSCHLTGRYPDWWEGRRFKSPINAWAAGDTNETTRDIIQKQLLGGVVYQGTQRLFDGVGIIPYDCHGKPKFKINTGDLLDHILIRHESGGWSELAFKSYEQGRKVFQGTAKHLIWLDEECPMSVYNECLIRTATTNGIVLLSFTPLLGMSEVVRSFLSPELMEAGNA